MSSAHHPARGSGARRLAAALALTTAACGTATEAEPAADPDLLLEVDGLQLWREDFDPLDRYLAEMDRTLGRKYRRRALLENHFLPLLLAERAFAEERAAMLERAAGLVAVAGNGRELEQKGAVAGGAWTEKPILRADLPIPVAAFAFRPEHIGAVSPPIAVPRGFVVASPGEIVPGMSSHVDRVRVFLVPFLTHEAAAFTDWLSPAREALRGKITHIHPDLEGALPEWLVE